MKGSRFLSQWRRIVIAIFVMILVVTTISNVAIIDAAYLVLRPITNGVINQIYLYAEQEPGGTATHKGVDIPTATGTSVIAAEGGVVVEVVESWLNNNHSDPMGFGNYVMIRSGTHYIKQNNGQPVNQTGWVFYIYMHLSQYSVTPIVGNTVVAGQQIAQSDNTGNSSGPHLHFQVDLYTDPSWVASQGNTSLRSRNPELWLLPRSVGSVQQATAVGKVTDTSGNPVGGLRICGMQKYDDPALTYDSFGFAQTYAYTWANPDDYLVENFATTDVQPGTYHLYARYANGTSNCNGTLYKDLGNYTFTAGQTTYIGLYPVYLPDVKSDYFGWNSSITIRNNSNSDTAKVTTTFFWPYGPVTEQRTDTIAPGNTVTFSPAGPYSGPALVVASQDVAVVVENQNNSTQAIEAYPGFRPNQAATSLALPLIFDSIGSAGHTWYTKIIVYNSSSPTAHVYVTFTPNSVGGQGSSATTDFYLGPNASYAVARGATFFGSAGLTSDQPVVAIGREYADNETSPAFSSAYPAVRSSLTPLYLPVLFKQIYSQGDYWHTAFQVQNLGASSTTVRVTYTCESSACGTPGTTWTRDQTVSANNAYNFDQRYETILPASFFGSARVESLSSSPIAIVVNERPLDANGNTNRLDTYVGAGGGTSVSLPRLQKYWVDSVGVNWSTSVAVRNPGGQAANIQLRYYAVNGTQVGTTHTETVQPGRMSNIDQRYDPALSSASFDGTGVITSDQPVVAEVNRRGYSTTAGDKFSAYNGITP